MSCIAANSLRNATSSLGLSNVGPCDANSFDFMLVSGYGVVRMRVYWASKDTSKKTVPGVWEPNARLNK